MGEAARDLPGGAAETRLTLRGAAEIIGTFTSDSCRSTSRALWATIWVRRSTHRSSETARRRWRRSVPSPIEETIAVSSEHIAGFTRTTVRG